MDFFKFECKFCGQKFKYESRFLKHKCKEMQRHEEMHSITGEFAFALYKRWLEKKSHAVIRRASFINSSYFNTFIKIAEFLKQVDIVRPSMYVDFMVRKKISPAFWTRNEVYVSFTEYLDRNIPPSNLISITVDTILEEAEKHDVDSSELFDVISSADVLHLLEMRRLSPWLLTFSMKFQVFYKNMNISHREIVSTYFNSDIWKKKFEEHPRIVKKSKIIVKELGL